MTFGFAKRAQYLYVHAHSTAFLTEYCINDKLQAW